MPTHPGRSAGHDPPAAGWRRGRVGTRRSPMRATTTTMARKKQPPISDEDREVVGALLRDLRKGAGYRSVEAASGTASCPASRQTIYLYERGDATPSLPQFLDLVRFYVLDGRRPDAIDEAELRTRGVAAVTRALQLPVYHVAQAWDLIARMHPDPTSS
jgi:DNA-binding XRE family transcriptional regulator